MQTIEIMIMALPMERERDIARHLEETRVREHIHASPRPNAGPAGSGAPRIWTQIVACAWSLWRRAHAVGQRCVETFTSPDSAHMEIPGDCATLR